MGGGVRRVVVSSSIFQFQRDTVQDGRGNIATDRGGTVGGAGNWVITFIHIQEAEKEMYCTWS